MVVHVTYLFIKKILCKIVYLQCSNTYAPAPSTSTKHNTSTKNSTITKHNTITKARAPSTSPAPSTSTKHNTSTNTKQHITSTKNEHQPRTPNTSTKYSTSPAPRESKRDGCERVVREQERARGSERESSERVTERCERERERERDSARERHRDARAKVVRE